MERALLGEVLDCLSGERRVFPYFKHRYALLLLALVAGRGRSVSELRQSRFGSLLAKPIVGSLARRERLCADELESVWPGAFESYVVTLGRWGDPRSYKRRGDQMTRRGEHLVLQLNFSAGHDRAYRRLIKPDEDGFHPFEWSCHPVNASGRRTLAWARLDLDLDEGEALIEELQCDWVRDALWIVESLRYEENRYGTTRDHWVVRGTSRRLQDFKRYVHDVLAGHRRLWDEALLSATIQFLVRDVGVRQIYMHTWEGGRVLKGMSKENPPRSVYEKLPRRFCFEPVQRAPTFLEREPGHRFRRQLRRIADKHGFWYLGLDA